MPTGRIFLQILPGYEEDCERKLKNFQETAPYILGITVSDLPFHFLLGPYDYIIEFTCQEFDDVSLVLLQLRQHMCNSIINTLTLLERRVYLHKEAPVDRKNFRCMMLILAKPGNEKQIEDALGKFKENQLDYLDDFSGVFGPYDYVVDFGANDFIEVNQKTREIRSLLKDYINQSVTLLLTSHLDRS